MEEKKLTTPDAGASANRMPQKIKNPLRKRIPRQFKQDAARYIALFLFMTMVIAFVSGFLIAENGMRTAYDESPERYHLEDGHFATNVPMTEGEIEDVESAQDVSVFPFYYKDRTDSEDRSIRLYNLADRKDNNKVCLMEGDLPQKNGETVVDRLFAENNNIEIGDTITISDKDLKVVGKVAVPDYSALFQRNSDMMLDASTFTFALVREEDFEAFGEGGLVYNYIWYNGEAGLSEEDAADKADEILDYLSDYYEAANEEKVDAYAKDVEARLDDNPTAVMEALGVSMTDPVAMAGVPDRLSAIMEDEEALEAFLDEPAIAAVISNIEEPEVNYLTDFLQRYDNQAVMFSGNDLGRDLVMIMALVYVLMAVIGFIYAVTCRSTVEKEAATIGTLRASGYTRFELLRHYMVLPVLSSILAALLGNVLGYTVFRDYAAGLYYHSYSLPTYKTLLNEDAFILTTVWPLIIITLVTFLVLAWALRLPPLQFLRGELKTNKKRKVMSLQRGSFFHRFRLRVIFQNVGSYLVLFLGLFFASFILIFGMALTPLLDNFRDEVADSRISEYQYVLKAPAETGVEGAEKYCLTNLIEGENKEEILVYGVESDSQYVKLDFDTAANVVTNTAAGGDSTSTIPNTAATPHNANAKDEPLGTKDNPAPVYMSGGYMNKFRYEEGDVISLSEKYGNKERWFKILGEYDYDAALAMFMPRDSYNELFGESADYYSGYFSDKELDDIDEELVASIIDVDDLTAVADQMDDSLSGFMNAVKVFCVIIYILVIFLLTKTIVDRNAKNIGLLKILGYTNREAGRLYNTATLVIVIASLLVMQPLVVGFFRLLWSEMMKVMQGYLILWVPPWMTPVLVGAGIVSYLILYPILMRRIRKIPPGVVLAGQE